VISFAASRTIAFQAQECERIMAIARARPSYIVPNGMAVDGSPERIAHTLETYGHTLVQGESFHIASEPGELICLAARTVPLWPLRHSDLPTPFAAFFHFTNRPPVRTPTGPQLLEAISYCGFRKTTGPFRIVPAGDATQLDGVHIHWLFDSGGVIDDSWWFGSTSPRRVAWADPGEELDRLFVSLLAFLQQRVLVRHRDEPNRSARKLGERAGLDRNHCNVILLRKAKTPGDSSNEAGQLRDWSCRWWVAGHWRQQPCGEGRAERRPTWIAPYLKGPEDKPLRVKKRLFAVVR